MNVSTHAAEFVRVVLLLAIGIVLLGVVNAYIGGGIFAFLFLIALVTAAYGLYKWTPGQNN